MRVLLLVALLVVVAFSRETMTSQFAAFKKTFNKKYSSVEEEASRFYIFSKNMKIAQKMQIQNPLATFGPNIFSDLSPEEFKKYHNMQNFAKTRLAAPRKELPILTGATPSKWDWRSKGAVTPVKDQGQCGSCWSFSTTGNIEGVWFVAGNPLVSLSEQQLVSCDIIDAGCDGGFVDNAFTWMFFNTNGTLTTEAAYPYVSGNGVAPACKPGPFPVGAKITAYADIARNESAMAAQCAETGPVSVSLDATSFQFYTGGILTNCISQEIDHAVLVVGFDDTNSPPYWIIKNSWSSSWGESGYIRVQKGTNQCLIRDLPTTAIVPRSGPTPPSPTPAPVNPTPAPANPTPAPPAPSNKTYTQKTCSDSACTQGCQSQILPQNTCIQTPDGDSAIAVCKPDSLKVTLFPFSTDCTGFSFEKSEALNTCAMDSDGSYLENICPSSSSQHLTSLKMKLTKSLAAKVSALKAKQ